MIKPNLDEYLEFDSALLFENVDCLEIFGGAVRDSIAGKTIHDIDILCMRDSALMASHVLVENGYEDVTSKLATKHFHEMYKDVHIIFEPWTFMNANKKIVQLIRPVYEGTFDYTKFSLELYYTNFINTIREVDISACGVSWDGTQLYERYPDAIKHCKFNVFTVNTNAKMYNDRRIIDRKWKLEERGWTCIDNKTPKELEKIFNNNKLNLLT